MELGDTSLQPAVMCNVLGDKGYSGPYDVRADDLPRHAFLHMYGKKEAKPNRKLGHITVLDATPEEAQVIRNRVYIQPR